MRRHVSTTAAILALLLGGCSMSADVPATPSSPADPSTGAAAPTTSAPEPSPTGTPGPDDVRAQPRVAAAIADLAIRENVAPAQVVIAASTPVTWSDGSIGCPEPGTSYTQALVEGELLILRVGTGLHQYHSSGAGPYGYCADPTAGYAVP